MRIEDIDPPREQPGATQQILQSLEDHGLHWDGEILYQSQRLPVYEDYLRRLEAEGLLYACDCTRQDLAATGGIYKGHCRQARVNLDRPHATRLKLYDLPTATLNRNPAVAEEILIFDDLIQGLQVENLRTEAGDQILKRKDGLIAYQLAVVVDDIEQHITHIIRGSDLLGVTARQIFLYRLLAEKVPTFGHVTLATYDNGQKLSKQNFAPALNKATAGANLWQALTFLGQNPPPDLRGAAPQELLEWSKCHWQLTNIRGLSATI